MHGKATLPQKWGSLNWSLMKFKFFGEMWQLGFQGFMAAVFHVMDDYKLQWSLLVLMSCRNVMHPSSGWMNGYRGDAEMMGWMERCQCGKVWGHMGYHSYRKGKRRYDLVLSQQANPAMQEWKQTSSLCTFLSIAVIGQTPSNLPI